MMRSTEGEAGSAPGTEGEEGAGSPERAASTEPDRAGGARGAEPGDVIGRFELDERLGAGGMGVVYLARDPDLGRRVAIKLLHAEQSGQSNAQARMLREARALASLSHPNVVVVHEVGVHEQQVYLVMEYVAGQTLREWRAGRAGEWRALVQMYRAAGEGLAAAHQAGIIHRDFKPDNVIVGEDGRPRVLDFGLAAPGLLPSSEDAPSWDALDGVELTKTGAVLGTPAYMAPEQFQGGAVDARTDQFAFCVSLWEALLGERPFQGETVPQLRARVLGGRRGSPSVRAPVPRSIVAALGRGLAVDPQARFESVEALLQALEPPRGRGRWSAGVAAVVVLGGVAAVAVGWPGGDEEIETLPPPARSVVAGAPDDEGGAATSSPPAEDRPALVSRALTETQGVGVTAAAADPWNHRIVYLDGSSWFEVPIEGGSPSPVESLDGERTDYQPGPRGHWYWYWDQGGIYRVDQGEEPRLLTDRRADQLRLAGRSYVSHDDQAMALTTQTGFVVVGMGAVPREPVSVELGSTLQWLAWSPDGSMLAALPSVPDDHAQRVELVGADGGLRSSTSPFSDASQGRLRALEWMPSGLVAVVDEGSQTWLQCLEVTPQGVTLGRRSAPVPLGPMSELMGAVGPSLVFLWVEARGHLVVLDLSVTPARLLEPAPSVRMGQGDAAWISDDALAFLAAEPPGALARVELEHPDHLRVLAAGPYDWLAGDGAGGLVFGGGDEPGLHHWRRGDDAPRRIRLPGIEASTLEIQCASPRECLVAPTRGPQVDFYRVDLLEGQVRRLFRCSASSWCENGRWGWSKRRGVIHVGVDGPLLGGRIRGTMLGLVDASTGDLRDRQAPPDWALIQSAAEHPGGDLMLTAVRDETATSPNGSYHLLRRGDDGEYRSLWSTSKTWVVKPRVSPAGRWVVMEGRTTHGEVRALDVGSLCGG